MRARFWAFWAIFLGVWETMALITHWVPTVTETSRRLRSRRLWHLGVVAWLVALGRHLLRR